MYRTLCATQEGRQRAVPGNQDAVCERLIEDPELASQDIWLLAVADGIGRSKRGGDVARYITEHLAHETIFHDPAVRLAEQLQLYLESLYARFLRQFSQDEDMLASGATLSVLCLQGDYAQCYWVGDSPIHLTRRQDGVYQSIRLSEPDKRGRLLTDCFGCKAPFRLKYRQVYLGPGDIITATSDGIRHDADMLSHCYQEFGFRQEVIVDLFTYAAAAVHPDDVSIVAAQRVVEEPAD